ncbi:MAG TPA: peptidylprolyl isomerase, partial [Candidatus Thermoplasmatota archaeon]|nr:peptidylprolyl isomerase [Candidatus Thermoplasmatota archaeon]
TPGRVRVDFNHPFAGKVLKYRFRVVEEVTDPVARARVLVDMDYGQGRAEGFEIKIDGDTVELGLPDSCKYDQRWFVAKYRLVSDLRSYAGAKTIRFVETYADTPALAEEPGHEGHGHEPGEHQDEPAKKELVEEEML